jgi:two-component system OmpR family sensor kinase
MRSASFRVHVLSLFCVAVCIFSVALFFSLYLLFEQQELRLQGTHSLTLASRCVACILLIGNILAHFLLARWLVHRILRPISSFTTHAAKAVQQVGGPARLAATQALTVSSPKDELDGLTNTFNELLAKIDVVVSQTRQFVTDVSHELRTPLAVLRGETELVLSKERSREEYQKSLGIIEDELEKLIRIVEALFTLSVADAGQLRLAEEPLYLNEVLAQACAMVSDRAFSKNIQIERQLITPVLYLGDEAIIRQLCIIFLDNSIKYSDCSTVISVGLVVVDNFIRLTVEDQGIGIPKEMQKLLFQRFYRGSNPLTEETQSGGLGLAIAKVLTEAHGGSIECESEVGRGSRFTVVLPCQGRVIPYSSEQDSAFETPDSFYRLLN